MALVSYKVGTETVGFLAQVVGLVKELVGSLVFVCKTMSNCLKRDVKG